MSDGKERTHRVEIAEEVHGQLRQMPHEATRTSILSNADYIALEKAVLLLENPGLVARCSSVLASPIEWTIDALPEGVKKQIGKAAEAAISGALALAIKTMSIDEPDSDTQQSSDWWHMGLAAASGGIGGFFGVTALLVELPVSTTLMLRSIADIARSEGADLTRIETQLECVSIFAYGGDSSSDDGAQLGYYIAREAMAKMVANAVAHCNQVVAAEAAKLAAVASTKAARAAAKELAEKVARMQAPLLVEFVNKVAARYSVSISESAMAKAAPVIGSIFGAAINSAFMAHFQDMARGHFSCMRMERIYGKDLIREEYRKIRDFQLTKKAKSIQNY